MSVSVLLVVLVVGWWSALCWEYDTNQFAMSLDEEEDEAPKTVVRAVDGGQEFDGGDDDDDDSRDRGLKGIWRYMPFKLIWRKV